MPTDEPRVRVELVSDPSFTAPEPVEPPRLPPGPLMLMIMAVFLIGAFVGLDRLSDRDTSSPDDIVPNESEQEVSGTASLGNDSAGTEESNPALPTALSAQIDAYDRVTYAPASPELTSIVRSDDEWVTIDDFGLLAHSSDLLSWVVTIEWRRQRALALATTVDGPLALTTTGSELQVIRVSDRFVEQTHPITSKILLGALGTDGRWAVVLDEEDGRHLLTGAGDGSTRTFSLGDKSPTSIAVTTSHIILTLDDEAGATSLLFAPRSALTYKSPDEFGLLECDLAATGARLVTTGDSVVHLVEASRAWIAWDEGDRFDLVVDTTLLTTSGEFTVRPIATGVGWSIANPESPAADPMVWITRDGSAYEPQQVPSGRGRPGHIIWAYVGASAGVGVRVSDTGVETGLLRIGDVRARHPRPHELSRTLRVEHPEATIDLISPSCRGVAQATATSS